MPSYFVKVMGEDKGIAFVFDSPVDIKAAIWSDVQTQIFNATNEIWIRKDEETCDPKKMSIIALSKL